MVDHIIHFAKILLLLGIANGVPIVAKKLLGVRFAAPVDGGRQWFDGRPIFGESKTLRGIALALVITPLAAFAIGIEPVLGAGLAAASLTGDLASSFLKRRMGLPPHSQAPLLDQIPESLLPLILLHRPLQLSTLDIALLILLFLLLELVLSRLLFRLRIRDRPY